MSVSTFNYQFIPPPDLIFQTRELPVFPKRTNEETDIQVTIKKGKDWPVILVFVLGIITTGTAIYAVSSYFINKSKLPNASSGQMKSKLSPVTVPVTVTPKDKVPPQTDLAPLKIESLPLTDVKTISTDSSGNASENTPFATLSEVKPNSNVVINKAQKEEHHKIQKISKPMLPNNQITTIDKLPMSPQSLKEVERSTMPITTPKFILEAEPLKVQKGGIFKRPPKTETTEANKTQKPTQKIDTTPQSLF